MGLHALAGSALTCNLSGSTVPLYLSITDNTTGLAVTGQTPTVYIRFRSNVGQPAPQAQVNTVTVNTLQPQPYNYALTIDGVTFNSGTFVGVATQQQILSAILAAINTYNISNTPFVTGAVAGTGPTATLTLTSTTVGVNVVYTGVDSNLTNTLTTAPFAPVNDGYVFNGTSFVASGTPIPLAMSEVSATLSPGLYVYNFPDPGFPPVVSPSLPITQAYYEIRYNNAGTPTGDVYEIRLFSLQLRSIDLIPL